LICSSFFTPAKENQKDFSKRRIRMAEREIEVAKVEDYFSHVGVVAIKVTAEGIQVGDVLHFKGQTTDLIVEVSSMQVNHKPVKAVKVGESVGIKVNDRVRSHDKVYKVLSEG